MDLAALPRILDVYSLEEILEYNDLTPCDVLEWLDCHYSLKLPEVLPL